MVRRRRETTRDAALITALVATGLVLGGPAIAALRQIDGSSGADRIVGSRADDVIFGLEGDDVLRGKAGEDRLVAGPGDDLVKGGPGRDTYICGRGFDVVVSDFSRHPDEHAGSGCEAVIFESRVARN
jgi:Ca2+-binding RTX toxin-like protein